MKHSQCDVLIVGAGPTGLTLACSLAKRGIKFRIIDKRNTETSIPRAINISGPTLDIFNLLGMDEKLLNEGIKLDNLAVHWNKKRLLNINFKYVKVPHPYFFHLEQSRIEFHLKDLLLSNKIEVDRQIELIDIEQDKTHVTASTRDIEGNIEKNYFHYVVGCDGGSSAVRELIKVPFNKEILPGYFILMDAVIEHASLKKQLNYYLGNNGYLIIAPLPKNKYRMIASFGEVYPGKEKLDLSKENLQEIIDKRGPGKIKIKETIWATSAGFYQVMAEKAQVGKVFLAGDALHLFSPVGGTNMNIGIQDAYSLADKLASVINNSNKESYLHNYQSERLKIAEKVLRSTSLATHLLTRNIDTAEEDRKYLPIFKNRKLLKIELPRQFSGIDFT